MLPRRSGAERRTRTAAAGLAALLGLGLAACGDGGTGPDGPAEVTLDRTMVTLEAFDAAVNLSVSGTDSRGGTLSDGDVIWRSTDASVASVNSVGLVRALANGATRVVAAMPDGSAADTADVTVEQKVAGIRLSPSSAELPSIGDTAHFSATAEDANGNPVAGETTFAWSSSDPGVLEVDAAGVATAVDTGEADVIATTPSDSSGSARVEVAQPDPTVTDVSPATLVEGEAATITGVEFGSDVSALQVLIDGKSAPVASATDTEIQVTVPQYDCLPSRDAGLRVVVEDDTSDAFTARVEPDEATLSLAVGERRVMPRPEDGFCIQLPATSEQQTYLVGLQSVTETVGFTSAKLSLEAGGSGGSGSTSAATTAGAGGAAAPAGAGVEAGDADGRWTGPVPPGDEAAPPRSFAERDPLRSADHHSRQLALRRWEQRHLGPHLSSSIPRRRAGPGGGGGPVSAAGAAGADRPPLAAEIGSSPSVGDSVSIRVPDVTAQSACASYEEITAVVRKVGTRGVWLEDVANPTGGFTEGDWQALSDQFDGPVYGAVTDYFGETIDIDSNGRSAVVVTKELNQFGGVLGFVFAGDLFPQQSDSGTSCSSSDMGELAYTIAPDPSGIYGDTVSTGAMRSLYPNLVAHEFTHIIQFGRRFECSACDFPAVWILEGQATLAEEIAGHAVTGRQTGQNYGFDVAFNDDESDDTDWYADRFVDLAIYYGFRSQSQKVAGAPHRCSWLTGDWAGPCLGGRGVYGVPSAILRWINDHFGPTYPGGEQALQRDIAGNDDFGFANVEEVTGESMRSLLADWAAMLWTDDRVAGVPERLTLPSWDLVEIFQNLVSTARLQPEVRGYAEFSESFSVNAGSAIYYLLDGTGRPPVSVKARTVGGSLLPSNMQMWVVRTR